MTSPPLPILFRLPLRCLATAGCGLVLFATPSAAQYEPSRMPNDITSALPPRTIDRVPIFFPPFAPPLDRPVARSVGAAGRLAPPAEMASVVNELFYPQLGTRIVTRTLSEQQEQAVDQYLKAKRAAGAELRAELERLQDAEPAARRQELETFARKQTPKLAELEKTAEKLRTDLSSSGRGWGDLREWHLSDKDRRGFSPVELAQVMRAYAHYQPGLAPAQRRLLREISLELLMAGENTEKATANNPHVFFQPELSRISFPNNVPAELATRIASYQTKKSLLKKELFEAVRNHDGAALGFLRNPLRGLPEKQAARITELETLAEVIRVALAQHPSAAPPPPRSPLPAALTDRLLSLLRTRDLVEREAASRIDVLLSENRATAAQVSYRFEDDGLKFVVVPTRGRGGRGSADAGKIETLRTTLTEIADAYGRKLAGLVNERDAIRREAGTLLGAADTARIDAALTSANRAAVQKQNEIAYHDYRVAVFEPGLSPEQRRLLFDASIESLGLPLPRGELQPVRRASTW